MNKYYKKMIDMVRKSRPLNNNMTGMSDINVINDKIDKLQNKLNNTNLNPYERRNCIIHLDRLYKFKEQLELGSYYKREGKMEPDDTLYKIHELSPLDTLNATRAQKSYYEGLISYKEYTDILDKLKRGENK